MVCQSERLGEYNSSKNEKFIFRKASTLHQQKITPEKPASQLPANAIPMKSASPKKRRKKN
jgi:hypothetical protein